VGQSLLIFEASQSLSGTLQSVGLFWKNDQPVAENSNVITHNTHKEHIHEAGWIRSQNPGKQSHSLDRAANEIGRWREKVLQNVRKF
jgi:hypothetical protein